MLGATVADSLVFGIASIVCILGAVGVVGSRNPVHAALSLVVTLFGVAVLFVSLQAHFLAVVQVIVYAGAIVVLFLFVIMLLGVDREEALGDEPLKAQRWPIVVGLLGTLFLEIVLLTKLDFVTADPEAVGDSITRVVADRPNVDQLADVIFTRYLLAFEVTSVLLVIAVVGAVVLARRPGPAGSTLIPGENRS